MWVCKTHRKQHDGYSECDGGQHSHTNAQDECVVRVDSTVGVQQLSFHLIYTQIQSSKCNITFNSIINVK